MTSTEVTDEGLFPAEHRALRELYATARQLERHWSRLAGRLGAPAAAPLRAGAHAIGALLAELDERAASHGLHGFPAAVAPAAGSPTRATRSATSSSSATRRCGWPCSTSSTSGPSSATARCWPTPGGTRRSPSSIAGGRPTSPT